MKGMRRTALLLVVLLAHSCTCMEETAETERLIGWKGEVHRSSLAESHVQLPGGGRLPRVGFGTAGLGAGTEQAVRFALAAGYTLLDSAQAREWYREDMVGAALRDSAVRRSDLFLTSKVHPRHLGFRPTQRQVDVSLRELDTEYLDLLLLHYPKCWGDLCGGVVPEGTWRDSWRALEDALHRGVVRSIGVSNFDVSELRELLAFARAPVAVVQAHSDPFQANAELQALCASHGIAFQAYSSLGSQHGHRINPVLHAPPVLAAAASHNVSAAQVVLRWALQRGQCVIPKSGDAGHMAANRRLDFQLDSAQMRDIDALDGKLPPLE